jgi:D-inositol-3-phosphate glycosyltransferase
VARKKIISANDNPDMPMNIAMISYHTCPLATLGGKDTGGMNVYVRDLTRYLGKFGIHVDVFTRSQDEHVPHVLHDLGYGNRIVHIPAGPENPVTKKDLPTHIPEFVSGIREFAHRKNIQYDLIHSHYWMSGIAALSLKKEWQIPVLQMFHTLARLKITQSFPSTDDDAARSEGEQSVMDRVDHIIAATQDESEKMTQLYRLSQSKISVIPPGIDTTHFYPIPVDEAKSFIGVPRDEKMLLFVGRIEPLKGIDKILYAIANLQKGDILSNCPNHLIIIGGDPNTTTADTNQEMARLQQLCRDLNINNLVLFLGKQSQDTLPYYYSAAEIVLVPSHYESFGLVALEAMACGIPVIATQVGGLTTLVRNGVTGYTVPDDDPQALELSLTQLICKDEIRKRMSLNALAYAKNYSWDLITPKIIEEYKNLLEK